MANIDEMRYWRTWSFSASFTFFSLLPVSLFWVRFGPVCLGLERRGIVGLGPREQRDYDSCGPVVLAALGVDEARTEGGRGLVFLSRCNAVARAENTGVLWYPPVSHRMDSMGGWTTMHYSRDFPGWV